MRYEEDRLVAAAEELKTFSANVTDKDTLADLATIANGLQTMRPYVSVGLKVSASHETLEAIERLHENGQLTLPLWNTLMNALALARKRELSSPVEAAVRKPCRRVASRLLGRSLTFKGNRLNRAA